jgi:hypothetical protein
MILPPVQACPGTSLRSVPGGDTLAGMGEGTAATHEEVGAAVQVVA